jgi:predicted naringenin-chalcone synthase
MIGSHPGFLDRAVPSLGARLRITDNAVPELSAAAAAKAIAEWGRPAADITHFILSTNTSAVSPGPDLRVAALLGLRPTVQRTVLYFHGCSGGCSALRLAKDIAESNPGARVLAATADANVFAFHAPDENHLDVLVNSLFGDGAGAVIIGAEPVTAVERVSFYMVSAAQATLPGTERTAGIHLRESGADYHMSTELPGLVRGSIERCMVDVLAPLGLEGGGGWNGLFWAAHPGGRAILDSYEAALRLQPEKLAASRHVLSEFGNMLGATIIFVLDEMRRRRQDGSEDSEWGVLLGLGPGLTVETMMLKAPGRQNED